MRQILSARLLTLNARAQAGWALVRAEWRAAQPLLASAGEGAWTGAARGWADARAGWGRLIAALALLGALAAVLAPPVLLIASGAAMIEARTTRRLEAEAARAALAEAMSARQRDEALPPHVAFIDRFRSLDDARWTFADGWDNGPSMENDWRRSQLSLTREGLDIILGPNPEAGGKLFSSAELQSRESFRHGYYEVRMRVPRGDGLVVGVFTYTRPEGRASWEEIDIEILGRNTRQVELTYHVHGRSRQRTIQLPFDAADDFHSYGFEWTADTLRFFIDNELVHEARGASIERMQREQRFYIHLWNSAELWRWVGHINPAEAPWVLSVACVAQAREYRGESLCAP